MRRDRVLAPARSQGQRLAHHCPPGRRLPGRDDSVRSRLPSAAARHIDPERAEAERAGVAVREERVVGDRRERRRRCGTLSHALGRGLGWPALRCRLLRVAVGAGLFLLGLWSRGGHHATHGSCHWPIPATRRSASGGPHVPGAYPCTGGGLLISGAMMRHASSMPSWRVNGVLSPSIAACRRTSYGVGPSPPSSANSMSSVISCGPSLSARCASTSSRTPVVGSSLTVSWLWTGSR